MIDLNHGSGATYAPIKPEMALSGPINDAINTFLTAQNRAQHPRTYVSTSGIGRDCLRQIQYDFVAAPKDPGGEFQPGTLRIFQAGHMLEDVVSGWLKAAGFDLRTVRPDGGQFGFTALGGRFKGHIDGCLVAGPVPMEYPALWENKALGVSSWNDTVKRGVAASKPVYAAQIALYQAYMDLPNPALFTALNRDTWELYCELVPFNAALAQEMSDRAVQVIQATDTQELLPRAATSPTSAMCKGGFSGGKFHSPCPWADRCWSTNR